MIPLVAYFALKYTQSPLTGLISVNSVYGDTTIIFDEEYGIPYINGTTDEAVYFGLGFAQASDRLYDLQIRRAMLTGRLAEVLFILMRIRYWGKMG
jgi:penicillin amidase